MPKRSWDESHLATEYEEVHPRLRKSYHDRYKPILYDPFAGAMAITAVNVTSFVARRESALR